MRIRIMMAACAVGLLIGAGAASAQEIAVFDAKYNAVLSRLQSMGHGYYSAQEWADVEAAVEDLVADAEARKDGDAIIRAAVIKAMVLSDMRRQHAEAVQVLRQARGKVGRMAGVDASRLYVKEAEVHAAAGDPAAIRKTIAEYKSSAYYDPKPYAWSGGSQPGDPLVLARPGAMDNDSLPLSIMESALSRATAAAGVAFPDAVLTDVQGRRFTVSSFRGKVLLVDFFARGWRNWEEDRASIQNLWSRNQAAGFEVVSICLERNPAGIEALGLPGWVVPGAPELAKSLGVFGDRTTFLVDANGMILARNLRGQDLAFAVRSALGR